jgi:AAA15 family ATPase/GTPase
MKIKSLSIQNFKGIKEKAVLPVAPITLFFGANSTGKSTVLHAFLYLYEVIAKGNYDPLVSSIAGEQLYFGGFKNLVHGKDLNQVVTLGVSLDFSQSESDVWDDYLSDSERWLLEANLGFYPDSDAPEISFEIDLKWDNLKKRVFISRYQCKSNGICYFKVQSQEGKPDSQITHYQPLPHWQVGSAFQLENIFESGEWDDVSLNGQNSLPDIYKRLDLSGASVDWSRIYDEIPLIAQLFAEASLSQATLAPVKLLVKKLENMFHIGPLRIVPSRSLALSTKTNTKRWFDGKAGWDLFAYSGNNFQDKVNEKFNSPSYFNSGYKFTTESFGDSTNLDKRVVVQEISSGVSLLPSSVGVGLSQVFPFVVATSLDKDLLIACEQPELHIHPKWQLALADMMLTAINQNPDRMFFIETHSEHILLRLLKRRRFTAEGELDEPNFQCLKADVQIIFCEKESGKTKLIPIKTTDEGDFDAPWPNGFFEERREELF